MSLVSSSSSTMSSSKTVSVQQRSESFFEDSFFQDSWGDFDQAVQSVLDKFDRKVKIRNNSYKLI